MASKKKSSNYTSKGQRPNVSNRIRKAVKRNSTISPTALITKHEKRLQVMFNPQNTKERELAIRYRAEDEIATETQRLMSRFGKCGLTRSAAIMAVKTDYKDKLTRKWAPILREWNRKREGTNAYSV